MKYVILSLLVLSLTGCGWFERKVVANFTGYGKMCVDGVQYLQFASGATVQYDKDGKVVLCK
jgi:hypothetical protein